MRAGKIGDEGEGRRQNKKRQLESGEWKDTRGNVRFHGAFHGGFNAGYFNTVGSEKGWTPSAFVSSRHARVAPEDVKNRPEGQCFAWSSARLGQCFQPSWFNILQLTCGTVLSHLLFCGRTVPVPVLAQRRLSLSVPFA